MFRRWETFWSLTKEIFDLHTLLASHVISPQIHLYVDWYDVSRKVGCCVSIEGNQVLRFAFDLEVISRDTRGVGLALFVAAKLLVPVAPVRFRSTFRCRINCTKQSGCFLSHIVQRNKNHKFISIQKYLVCFCILDSIITNSGHYFLCFRYSGIDIYA